jgi:hypothetical protein
MAQLLYSFQPPDAKRILCLEHGKLWFSDPSKFNDPKDMQLTIANHVRERWSDSHVFEKLLKKAVQTLLTDEREFARALFVSDGFVQQLRAWIDGTDIGGRLQPFSNVLTSLAWLVLREILRTD